MIDYILSPQSVEALGWTLLHSLWQGAAFAILLALILIALRSYTAQSRYVVTVGILCAFFLTVSATCYNQWQDANSLSELTAIQLNKELVSDALVLDNSSKDLLQSVDGSKNSILNENEIVSKAQTSWLLVFKNYYEQHLPLLVTIWLLGVLFLQLRFLGQLAYIQRLKHYGTQLFPEDWKDRIKELEDKLRIQKRVDYLTSLRVESPMVIGWLKPIVLVPRQLFNSLSETEIYTVLAHELAHIRREDFIINLIQTFLCNVFFFHPGVWWMSHRIDDEREHCCDDLAVAATGPATSYAKTLINVSELQLRMHENPALSMAFSGKSKKRERGGFSSRIKRLFMVGNGTGTFREGFATACILISALFLGAVATGRTVQETESLVSSDNSIDVLIDSEESTQNLSKPINSETTVTITTEIKDAPLPEVSQAAELNELPAAIPAKPEVPVATQFGSNDTRVDALIMACEEGDIKFVKTLVDSGIDVNGVGSEGFTPLMMAANNDEAEIVNYLIKKGADVDKVHERWTALIEAADEGSLKSMKYLLKAGANVNYYATKDSPTAITMAASEGKLACLKLLIDYGADINGIGQSVPPLHIAAAEGKNVIVDHLISVGVDINKQDSGGRTALMYAASEGKRISINKLIDAGADISIVDFNGATAKDHAIEEDEYFPDNNSGGRFDYLSTKKIPAIHQATLDGLIEKVQLMVEQGTNVNSRDDEGRTPLHIASGQNFNLDMRVLLNLGAEINAQDYQGRTPLIYAAAAGEGDAAALLVSELANVNVEDVNGMNAYDWAVRSENSNLSNFLRLLMGDRLNDFQKEIYKEQLKGLFKEKDVNETAKETVHVTEDGVHLRQYDIEGKNQELLEVARHGTLDDCRRLLDKGILVNSKDDTGQTALMVAARTNRLHIAKFLIDQGADVNSSSYSGLTALHYAALENYDQMAGLLLKHNAEVDPTMRYSSTDGNYDDKSLVWEYIGATPLLIAVESQNIEVISVLIDAGANPDHTLMRNEFTMNENRESYLTASEVMGLDEDFRQDVENVISDHSWTPYKQALLTDEPAILALFQK